MVYITDEPGVENWLGQAGENGFYVPHNSEAVILCNFMQKPDFNAALTLNRTDYPLELLLLPQPPN